jgi:hypothetical protein
MIRIRTTEPLEVASSSILSFDVRPVNKTALIAKIIEALEAELALYAKSARAAHEEATHEQSKAENKYDTRGLEASYLAHGQAQQIAEVEFAVQAFGLLEVAEFSPGEPIDMGALVELETLSGRGGEQAFYFIGPKAGGTEVELDGNTVLVITLQSPLGR